MQAQYDTWLNSSHSRVATCNDCHLSGYAAQKLWTKADNVFFHSLAFTTGGYPDPIRIKPRNQRVTQAACLNCHTDLVHALVAPDPNLQTPLCVHCHASAGHALR
jgi:cytochrome c nitrite reductase small subunit